MKKITALFILIFICGVIDVIGQEHSLIYEDLDQAILEVWYDNELQDYNALVEDLRVLSSEWEKTRVHLSQNIHCEHIYCESFCSEIDYAISALETLSMRNRYQYIEENILYLIQEFAYLRMAYEIEEYPLDHLWLTYRMSIELNSVANDQMLDLLEWGEFEDVYCSLSEMWLRYRELSVESNKSSLETHPDISNVEDAIIKLEVAMSHADLKVLSAPTSTLKDGIAKVLRSKSVKYNNTITPL